MQTPGLLRAVVLCSLLVVCGCGSGPQIRVDMDPTTNLRTYRTFAFFEPAAADRNAYTTRVAAYLKRDVRAQMERLGFVYSESEPDLKANFYINVVEKQEVRTTSPGYYSYRSRYYGTWGGYPYVETIEYREGTLGVDLVDAKKNQLVWQCIAEGEVHDDALKDPGPALDRVVTLMFSNFPEAP